MTRANPATKVLRVGVIYNGRILDEQIIRKPETIYVGDSPKCHFVVPSSSLPDKYPLFGYKSGRYELVLLKGMTGKIFIKGKVVDVEEVIDKGVLNKRGRTFILPLSADARGKIAVGSAIVLFQFITPPPRPPKLKLPRSIKGSWTQMVDWTFISLQSVVFVLGYIFFSWLTSLPAPEPVPIEKISNRFAKLIVPKIEELKVEEKEKKPPKVKGEVKKLAARKKEAEKKPESGKEVARKRKPRDAATRAKEEAMRLEQMKKKVAGIGLLKLIGTAGEGSEGMVIANVLGEGGKDKDIDTALSGVKQIGIATSAGQRSRKGDAGAVKTKKVGDLKVAKSSKVGIEGGIKKKAVVAKTKIGVPQVEGTIDRKGVNKVVRMHTRAIRRCYEKQLKANPNLKGKISVTFMINDRGRVQLVEITADTVGDPKVATCIKSVVKRWRFPRPEEGPVSIEYPFVFFPSN